jgi:K(+)-stimulated pyrophosphate-energized sodium pump
VTTSFLTVLAGGAISLGFLAVLVGYISRRPRGNERMVALSRSIQQGAAAFLEREYRTVLVVMLPLAALIALFLDWRTAICFLLGAGASGVAGFVGMAVATRANTRTTEAARHGLRPALRVALAGGAVMGMAVTGSALVGLFVVLTLFAHGGVDGANVKIISGYAMGASLMALFARAGGGIYTKGADMGADLVGKVEAGIPEDDPRNPAVIADNVGDNVGDVAGLGADLNESYIESIIASLALAVTAGAAAGLPNLPIYLAALGVVASVTGVAVAMAWPARNPRRALSSGTWLSAAVMAVGAYWVVRALGEPYAMGTTQYSALGPYWAVLMGILSGIIVGYTSEYFTSGDHRPVRRLAAECQSGAAVAVTGGLAVGMQSTALPVLTLAVAVVTSYQVAGMFGVAMAALGMLATTGMVVAVDSYGPIADNAGGIAEMAGLHPDVRATTSRLDAVGNTTAAVGKGFAIGSAAFAALALVSTYLATVGLSPESVSLLDPKVMAGLLLGGMLPFLFSSMLFRAVGKVAWGMIQEVRRQFREIDGLMEGKSPPDSARCVDISTRGALHGMLLPGVVAIATPLIAGFSPLGAAGLGALLTGAVVTGLVLGIQTANSGGAMDNAKKYIEEGNLGGAGSDTHKAAVVGDTVGDPLKDTVGPSINILIKLMSVIALVVAPLL